MRAWRSGLAAMGALGLAAAPAAALDTASGVYEGKATCRQIVGGAAAKSKHEIFANLLNTGADITLTVTGTADFAAIGNADGLVAADTAKTDRGAFAAFTCGGASENGVGVHGDLVIKSTGKATVKGTTIHLDTKGATVRTCTFSAKRTSITAPPIIPCTPAP